MSVLLDVLNIAREKRYMVLDPVNQDPPESKTGMYVVAKKKVTFCFINRHLELFPRQGLKIVLLA